MPSIKTILATGGTSGIGLELIRQLLTDSQQSYRFLLAARDVTKAKSDFEAIKKDADISVFKVDFSNLKEVKAFAHDALSKLGDHKLDYVVLNAGMAKGSAGPGPHGSQWCETQVVNHLSQHYLLHLLREKISSSHSRVLFVSSGAARIKSTDGLREKLLAGSDQSPFAVYGPSKFVQLLGAHWWRRQLGDSATVVASSPGMVPGTGLSRHTESQMPANAPDAISIPQAAKNLRRAMEIQEFPEDPDAVYLASWGEWWDPKKEIPLSLDKKMQDEWCPSKEEIEREAKL